MVMNGELMLQALVAVAFFAAAILGILWFAFALKELWQIHTLARLRRMQSVREADANRGV